MEVRHLRYFVAVAEEASFSRAAERLGMATSPLSRRVRDLEGELGVRLFVRDYHRVTLTDAGRALVDEARGIVERLDALPGLLPPVASRGTVVTVGTAPEVSADLRSRFLALVRAERPGLVVRQRPASTAPLVRAVLKGEVDLAFVHGRVDDPRLSSAVVESQPVRVVVAQGIGFDGRDSLRLAELAHLPYTSLKASSAPFVAPAADTLLARHGVAGRLPVQATHAELVPMVSAGEAFTMCGARFGATRNVFLQEPVLLLPFEDDRERLETHAVWRADRGGLLHGLPALSRCLRT
ncbi:LysR-family transcriptional regulator [Pseudonocardia sp. Ae168_Ps1]|uniref:LysR family transcriptional regulator n=1 Tax=unclassified Pseudonocardia TaxID=2619320 RepID=UPI00094AADF7|nr:MULTISPECIES: LysR family transcriptional regulator [unclassified Pseudonocardia]OLL75945.1 LysR-family transcriptional regulator [Pseudonocardia sp. Ae150A_Ps1]OLL81943.1 LysR-family transcriptional regulator [Pseudonocardia sp. Ae168_Ps1]OLL83944.1 LysR-family transcriptional regulator [Pseudonocardia sp. Ae263_Ps1]OLL96037.1 LysR-family transcriptional regulator [Pseudonocardia sp. Ae356_Ps1]